MLFEIMVLPPWNNIFTQPVHLIDKSSRFGQDTWSLNSLHNLYYLQYSIHMNDFIIIDSNEKKGKVLKNE